MNKPLLFSSAFALSLSAVALQVSAQPAPQPQQPAPAAPAPPVAPVPPQAAPPEPPPAPPAPEPAVAPQPAPAQPGAGVAAGELSATDAAPAQTESSIPGPAEGTAPREEAPAETEPTPPKKLSVGEEGLFQPGALLQGWFWLLDPGNGEGDTTTTFRLRRAELRIKGEIVPEFIGYQVMIDPAKLLRTRDTTIPVENQDPPPTGEEPEQVTVPVLSGDTSVLQDFFITFMTDYVDVSLGQFKIPLSWEGYNSSSKTLFPERSRVSRHYGDRRDVGLRFEKKFDYFSYMGGVYNGDGLNTLDSNNQKDVALRLEVYPIEGLMVGAVGYTSVGEREEATTKDRAEVDARLELGDVLLQAEYLHGWDGSTDDTRREGHGFYVAGGYTFFDALQPIVRFGFLDTDLDSEQAELTHYEFGVNYYFQKHEAKLQAVYGIFDGDAVPGEEPSVHEFIVAAQLSF